jgi:carbon-monoxide dehydrogenase medium subunit
MIPAAFEYDRPATLDEAVGLLALHARTAKVLAGGQSLLPLLKLRLARPERLIDIGRIGELRGIRRLADGRVSVGALTTYSDLLDSADAMAYGVLRDAVPGIADIQVRNRGTVGGAIAHADPASDLPAILLALEADVAARSVRGDRTIPISTFFEGAFESVLAPDEILTSVILPGPPDGAGSAYRALEQPASGYSIVGVAAVVFVDPANARLAGVHVGVTGVADVAYRATAVERALVGNAIAGLDIAAAAKLAAAGQTVRADIHADSAYRTRMAEVHVRRALEAAIARAG